MMYTNNYQSAIHTAWSHNRAIKKSDLGTEAFAKWEALSNQLISTGYEVWADDHNQAGRSIRVVSEELAKAHKDDFFAALRELVNTIGEVNFADNGSAVLMVNQELADTITSICHGSFTTLSEEMKDINDKIDDCRFELKLAEEDFKRYNFNGVEAEVKLKKFERVQEVTAKLESLRKDRTAISKKAMSKTQESAPADEKVFAKNIVTICKEIIDGQSAMLREDYLAKKEAQRKARRDATKAKRSKADTAKKQAEAELAKYKAELAKMQEELAKAQAK